MKPWVPNNLLVTADMLPALIARYPLSLVHVWAVWSGYVRKLDAILAELQPQFGGRLKIVALDFDDARNFELLRRCGVLNLPTLLCFVQGEHHETVICPPIKERVVMTLNRWLREATGTEDETEEYG